MKIGIFTDTYNPTVSGVVTSINMVEKEMRKRGHEVYIIAPSKSISPTPNDEQNLYMLKSMPLLVARQYKNRLAAFYSRDIANKIKELDLDIIHTQSEFSIGHFGKVLSKKFDIPFIHTYHTMWEDYMHYLIPVKGGRNIYPKMFARTFSRNFVRKAECIITPSKKTEKYLKYRCKITNKPIYIIPTGIDLDPFKSSNFSEKDKSSLRKSLGIKENDNVIIFLGRVAEEKSVDVLMDAMPEIFKKLPNTKFLVVGDGPSKKQLEEQAKELKISENVIFTGKVPWTDVPKYYNISDIFVNASLTETQGLTFLESMAAGLPVVAKYAPNLTEYIFNNKNGILVKKNNEFAKTIISVLEDKELKNRLSNTALDTVKQYSIEEFGDKLEMLYKEIIKSYKLKKTLNTRQEKEKQKKTLYKTITDELLSLTRLKK